jgi:hypothetical protein
LSSKGLEKKCGYAFVLRQFEVDFGCDLIFGFHRNIILPLIHIVKPEIMTRGIFSIR